MNPPDPRLAAYLAAVEAAMVGAGAAPATIAGTRASLEEHIATALAGCSVSDTLAVGEVLAGLDRPEDFAADLPPPPEADRWGSAVLAIALAAPLAGVAVGLAVSAAGGQGGQIGWLAFTALDLVAVASGLVLRRSPRARVGAWIAAGVFAALLVLAALFPSH